VELIPTAIADVLIIEPKVFGDDRGFFLESWNEAAFAANGLELNFVQDNHSRSSRGVLRGLHYQKPNPQGKLVRVTSGSVFDVVVDMRASSVSFGVSVGVLLSATNKRMLWVPPGMAHGFLCLDDGTDFLYKCTSPYSPSDEQCLLWKDPALGIDWPLEGIEPLLSPKDRLGLPFAQAVTFA
jgi:dTDP-4-dehydrorhamnose 3,5-epimerase